VLLAAVLRVALEGVALLCAGSDGTPECEPLDASLRSGHDGDAPDPNAGRQPVEPSVSQSDAEARRISADRGRGGPPTSALAAASLASLLRRAAGSPSEPSTASQAFTLASQSHRPAPRGPPR
jgi:hypothetical protein